MTLIVGSVIGVGMGRPASVPLPVTPAEGRAVIGSLADIAAIVAGEASTSVVAGAGATE